MKRLTPALAEADVAISAAKTSTESLETTLANVLAAAGHCEVAYLSAPDTVRRQINQGFFKRLLIGEDGTVEHAELTEPFAAILEAGEAIQAQADAEPLGREDNGTDDAEMNVAWTPQNVVRLLALLG